MARMLAVLAGIMLFAQGLFAEQWAVGEIQGNGKMMYIGIDDESNLLLTFPDDDFGPNIPFTLAVKPRRIPDLRASLEKFEEWNAKAIERGDKIKKAIGSVAADSCDWRMARTDCHAGGASLRLGFLSLEVGENVLVFSMEPVTNNGAFSVKLSDFQIQPKMVETLLRFTSQKTLTEVKAKIAKKKAIEDDYK